MKQTERVLRHMQQVGPITAMDAVREYGIMRLAARIYDLRRQGYQIVSDDDSGANREGKSANWTSYRLA